MFRDVKEHLKSSNMTYIYHLKHACHHANRLLFAALKSYIHAFLPWFFKYDGPRAVIKSYNEMRNLKHIRRMMNESRIKK